MVLLTTTATYAQENTTTKTTTQIQDAKITPTVNRSNPQTIDTTINKSDKTAVTTPHRMDSPPKAAYSNNEAKGYVKSSDIREAAVRVNTFIQENGRLPNYVKVGGYKVNMAEFLYFMTAHLNNKDVRFKTINLPPKTTGSKLEGSIGLSDYIKLANRVYNFIEAKNRAPSYASFQNLKIRFESLVWLFTKAINFKVTNQRLPNYANLEKLNNIAKISINSANPSSTSNGAVSDNSLDINVILDTAASLRKFIEKNQRLPTYVQVANQNLKVSQFLYLMVSSLSQIGNGKKTPTQIIKVNEAPNPTGNATGELRLNEYLQVADKITEFIKKNKRAPNYVKTSIGYISYDNMVYAVSKILSFYQGNGRLPNYVTVKMVSNSNPSTSNNGMSEYLQATRNCQVNDPSIQSLAATLTRGITNQWEKAKKIFNWVRDNISYSWYYNTRYGALGTLKARTGNCVDHSHLVIALFRASGLPARYVHGLCTFSSGTYGHVWAEVYVNGAWYSADATSTRNSLGVINNWDTETGKIYARYISLPF